MRRSPLPDQDTAIRRSPPVVPGKNRDREAFWATRTRAEAPARARRGSSSQASGRPEPPHELGPHAGDVPCPEREDHVARLERLEDMATDVGPAGFEPGVRARTLRGLRDLTAAYSGDR